ncbi:MAG: beta-lactamase family protein [Actinobacteria bacterium]|nr:beta-lactamase family protein [Actinomycetota bacterium]
MTEKFGATIDAKEVGLDATRLKKIDEHFNRYVDSGRLAGYTVVVARHGKVAHFGMYGHKDSQAGTPITDDTMYRIYSMTKPITSLALMILVERGLLQLTDPVSKFIESFGDTRVWNTGTVLKPLTNALTEPIRVWHLLTHTAGMTYGFMYADVVDDMYRRAGFEAGVAYKDSLEVICDKYAALPLLFQPGSSWNYSVATDIVGRIVEVVAKMPLDEFFQREIFEPLAMYDTGFYAPTEKHGRMASLYRYDEAKDSKLKLGNFGNSSLDKPIFLSGGGGLISTAADYFKFIRMLEGRGRSGDVRLVSSRTFDTMVTNHLPNNADVSTFGRPLGEEIFYDGIGFGLGFSVVVDQAKTRSACPNGTFGWGGMASTVFWVDPVNEISAMFFTQLIPSTTYPIRQYLRSLVYAAVAD